MANSKTIRRLTAEIRDMALDPMEDFDVYPDENNIFVWYFMIMGPRGSIYDGGLYIGQIIHSEEYPFKPPNFMMLTPSGRFIINDKICMTHSSYHASEWSPLWNVKAILNGFLSIMMDDKEHGIAHIKEPMEKRAQLAKTSVDYNKKHHPQIISNFRRFLDANGNAINPDIIKQKDADFKKGKKETEKNEPVKETKDNNNTIEKFDTLANLLSTQRKIMERSTRKMDRLTRKIQKIINK